MWQAREERTHSKSVPSTCDQSPRKPCGSNPGQLISQALQASSSTSGKGSSSPLHRAADAVLEADGTAADNADDRAAASYYLDIVPQAVHTSPLNADCDPLPGMLCDRPSVQAAHTGWKAGEAAPVANGINEMAGGLVGAAGLTVGAGSNAQELGASGSPLPWTPDASKEPSTAADAMASSSARVSTSDSYLQPFPSSAAVACINQQNLQCSCQEAATSDSTVGYSRQLVDEGAQQLPTAMAVAQVGAAGQQQCSSSLCSSAAVVQQLPTGQLPQSLADAKFCVQGDQVNTPSAQHNGTRTLQRGSSCGDHSAKYSSISTQPAPLPVFQQQERQQQQVLLEETTAQVVNGGTASCVGAGRSQRQEVQVCWEVGVRP